MCQIWVKQYRFSVKKSFCEVGAYFDCVDIFFVPYYATHMEDTSQQSVPVAEARHAPEPQAIVSEEPKANGEEAHVQSAPLPSVESSMEHKEVTEPPSVPPVIAVQLETPVGMEEEKQDTAPVTIPTPATTVVQPEAEKQQPPKDPDAYARKMLFHKS